MAEYSVFLRLGGEPQQVTEETLFRSDLAERLRRFQHDFPEWEMWQISLVRGNNVYDVTLGRITMEYVKTINSDPADFGVRDWVVVGFYKGNRSRPFILAKGTIPVVEQIALSWPTYRQSYGRSSRIAGTIAGSWAVEEDLHPTVIRLADSRWERRGADGLWSAEEPWQLYRDGSAVGESSLLMWHDLSVVGDDAIGLVAEEEGNGWFYDPDYPLPSETNSVTNGAWSTPLPNYEEDSGGGDDGGGDDDGGGIIL